MNQQQQQQHNSTNSAVPASHSPSLAGSVIEAPNSIDGLGGTTPIRVQNISSTGKFRPGEDERETMFLRLFCQLELNFIFDIPSPM